MAFHERYLGPCLGGRRFAIGTPDFDIYDELLEVGKDIDYVVFWDDPRRKLPRNIPEEKAYLFHNGRAKDKCMSAVERGCLVAEVLAYADEWRAQNPPTAIVPAGPPRARGGRRLRGKQPPLPAPGAPPQPPQQAVATTGAPPQDAPSDEDPAATTRPLPVQPLPAATADVDDGFVWVVADPSRGFSLGSETDAPEHPVDNFGVLKLKVGDGGSKAVLVEPLPEDELHVYPQRRLREIAGPSLPPPAVAPGGPAAPADIEKAILLVQRAQRAARSKADNDKWLFEQLGRLKDPGVRVLAAEIFSDSGSLKPSLGELLSKLKALGEEIGGETSQASDVDARVLPILRSPLGVRGRDFKGAVEAMHESSWTASSAKPPGSARG